MWRAPETDARDMMLSVDTWTNPSPWRATVDPAPEVNAT
jgi:hypothetical protein